VLQEELFFIYNPDKSKLEREKDLFIDELIENQKKQIEEAKKEIEKKIAIDEIDTEKFDQIDLLENNVYYDSDLKPLSFDLLYIDSEKKLEIAANYIKSTIKQE